MSGCRFLLGLLRSKIRHVQLVYDRKTNVLIIIVRFLDLIKPFTPLLPEVAAPEAKVPFNQKLMWTGVGNMDSGSS